MGLRIKGMKCMKRLVFAFLMIGCCLFLGKKFVFNVLVKNRGNAPTITIFIHGSRSAIKYILPKRYQSKFGLHSVQEYENDSHYFELAKIFEQKDSKKYKKEDFYIFGWNGEVSFRVRKNLAQNLYGQMKKISHFYTEKSGQVPKFQIITFSHGGNIALQLAEFLSDNDTMKLELTLIGCPIQATTESMVNHPSFEKVSVISSRGDLIQCADPHNLYGIKRDKKTKIFSRRFFDLADFDIKVQHKIDQYVVTVNNKKPGHIDLFKSFMIHIPCVLEQKSEWSPKVIEVNVKDPGFIFNKGYNLPWSLKGARKI